MHYDIPTDLPLVVQVSRFDKWKDPQGVIDAFRMARKEVDCTLVLVGNVATDDPEGQEVYNSLCDAPATPYPARGRYRCTGGAGGEEKIVARSMTHAVLFCAVLLVVIVAGVRPAR